MKTGLVLTATLALALTACERAPADGTSEQPEPKTQVEEGAEPADAADAAPAGEMTGEDVSDAPATGGYDGPIPKPIRVGTDGPEMDACGTYGEVSGLNPDGDNYLSVRDAPSNKVKERDRIGNGHGVNICAESNGWYGIVYDIEGDSGIDCEVGSPVPTPRNYTGPCAQGWVSKKFVTITAG